MVKTFFATAKPYKEDFMTNFTEKDEKLMSEHFQYLQKLQKEGKLYLAGPIIDEGSPFGIYIFKADSLNEARNIMENDPSIKGGVQTIETLREVKLSLHPETNL